MKRFLKIFFHSKIGRHFRNLIGFRPPIFLYDYEKQYLASDMFIWRTDHGFETIFKASDILKKYYEINSILRVLFYDSNGTLIKESSYDFKGGALTINIDKELLGVEDFGTFCVFNVPKENFSKQLNVTNRCYIGFGRNGSFSMLHGNIVGLMTDPNTSKTDFEKSIVPAVSPRKGTYKYVIQKKHLTHYTTTLGFSNPLNRNIMISVNGNKKIIKSRGCVLVPLVIESTNGLVEVYSDFVFPRPIVICDDGKFIDCHHA